MYKVISTFRFLFSISICFCLFSTLVFSQNKILFVVSNQDYYGTSQIRTANHFGEIAVPYDVFTKSGFTVDFVSPNGGAVPIGYINASDSIHKKFLYNPFFMNKLKNTMKPIEVVPENYGAIFYGGGGAAMFGVAENTVIQNLARQIYANNGIVSAICHGTAGLAYLKDTSGKSLYAGRKITGFADQFEDKKEDYYKTFPFAIDQAIKQNEGNFVHSDKLGEGFYVTDGRFVTGQDPSAGSKMASEIINLIEKNKLAVQPEPIKNLDKVFSEWDNSTAKLGVAAGLLKKGQIVYLKGFGSADLTHEIPINTDTKFQIGAMAKQFTAFAVLLLEEQGKLSLSDDVRKYIPQLPNFGSKITLKHLLSQSSGLHDFLALKEIAGWREKDVFTQKDALDLIFRQKKLDYEAGTKFSHTSSGLILLAEVVKQVTGQTLAEFSQEHIFQPLKMANTLLRDDNEMIIPNAAVSYQTTKKGLKNNLINHSIVGTTNLYTSAADLSRWYLNFENPKVGSKKLIEKLTSPVTLDDGKTTFNPTFGRLLYGQQYLHAERGVPKIWTYGLDGGYASNIFIFPNQKVTSFVLGNNNRYNGSLAMNMAVEVLGNTFTQPPSIDFSKLKTVKLSGKLLETYSGNYWDNERMAGRRIYVKNDTLRYQELGNANESKLVPIAENKFQMIIDGDDVIIVQFRKENGHLKMIYTSGESDEYVYEYYSPKTYSATNLDEFSGTYYSQDLKVSYTLAQNENGLFTNNKNQPLINLTPIQSDLFLSSARNLGGIRFIRDKQQKITGFYINSDRIKNLLFEKI
ncbi:serine hydrolase [Flavobacterium collinsii]|uniref:D-aminopeptidase n=1 Tax=Flavobacterium collinsii TaxID=1114861 RepID=A0A9W4X3R5_9FLAO|nr:serine hydrolase [Flavobacterium collinsii]CAI2767329.1 D-aminopeptidase [Flavobacterium collinsii]